MHLVRVTKRAYGKKIRVLRQRHGVTQAALAERLGVSASYLNLIENDRRQLTTALMLKLAQTFDVDLRYFGADDATLTADVMEVFGDGVFEEHPLTQGEVADFVAHAPEVAKAVVRLHQAYAHARGTADALGQRVLDHQEVGDLDRVMLSSEQVSELLRRHSNYFPELEAEAEALWRDAALNRDDIGAGIAAHLERAFGVNVVLAPVHRMGGAVRRFDPRRRELALSEALSAGSRTFQLASQTALLRCGSTIDRILKDAVLNSDEARALGRVALASYIAGAVVMPYEAFLNTAEALRYDIELLGQRFRTGFEQTCHRLTTLRRPGAEGIQFYFVRVDMAGNISKKLGAAGIRFPRFSGLCPLWNVHAAFLQPGVVRVQISKQLDGTTVFAIARTVRRRTGTYHSPHVVYSVGIGCDISHAHRLVYADGMDLDNPAIAVPIGITCRLCERTDCQARAFPSLRAPMRVDENVRGISFFATPQG
jgi:predicted transcriptional regulator/transcriptional regulator with XRE-family HTH domain